MLKKKLLWLAFPVLLGISGATVEAGSSSSLAPQPTQLKEAVVSAQVLQRYHYHPMPLDHAMSEKIFDRFLKSLDSEHLFLTQADIDQFSSFRSTLGDALMNLDLGVPYQIFNLYQKRALDRYAYSRELLKQGFDFTVKESYMIERDKEAWPKNEDEARDLWRKRVKNDWLRLKLAGKDDAAIRETLNKRYENVQSRLNKYKADDVFETFMNAYAMSIDPHTNYMGVKSSEEFDISMRLSLTGIGAVLQQVDDYTVIREIVPGSPAALSGKLQVGDKIVGVAQGAKGAMVDVVGWRNDDVVSLIRGPLNSVVMLDVLPADAGPDAKHKQVTMTRAKIALDKQSAKKSVMTVKDGDVTRKIGVISLPGFYQDFEAARAGDADFKSATRDVAKLLEELKKEKVESVLIDLRNNGGGSLKEAVELTGLFIGKGAVVQQRDSRGQVAVERSNNAPAVWDGPMGVLINHASASASEIFAAAIQDYGRGLIIGEPSFGKGTVQSMIGLNNWIREDKAKSGSLKMTVAQFFRINGGTTQLRGVVPDISLPSMIDSDSFGESSYDNALPYSQIRAADYVRLGDLTDILPALESRHQSRVAKDKDFQYLLEDIAYVNAQRKKNMLSLNEADRRKERDLFEARQKAREANEKRKKSASESGEDDGLQADERSIKQQIEDEKERKDARDVLLVEAVNVLGDEVGLLKTNTKLAARVLPALYARGGHD